MTKGDAQNETKVKRVLDGWDTVFHLTAIISVNLSMKNPLPVNKINVGKVITVDIGVKASVSKNRKKKAYLTRSMALEINNLLFSHLDN